MRHHRNNYDALRLLGALLVLLNHSMELSAQHGFGFAGQSVSTLGVKIFFCISGYLVATSWMNDPNPLRFLVRRARRILPALALVVILGILVIGPVFTTVPLAEYFASPMTFRYLGNIVFYVSYALPGVFATLPIPYALNGSLWTLPVEVTLYVLVPIYVFAGRRHAAAMVALFLAAVALSTYFFVQRPALFAVAGTEFWTASTLVPYFVGGALLASLRLERFLDARLGVAGIVLMHFLAPRLGYGAEIALCVVLPYATIAVGRASWLVLREAGRWGDFSYGIYLWAFPIQQSIVQVLGTGIGGLGNAAIALPLTLGMAALSYHLVEKRAMRIGMSLRLPVPTAPVTS
ncbi:MAG: acyltransferase family protein [Rubritepida sp.]|nr:acyltransferase family protein [Rubritepida sp.]